jgi:hypothetical protein
MRSLSRLFRLILAASLAAGGIGAPAFGHAHKIAGPSYAAAGIFGHTHEHPAGVTDADHDHDGLPAFDDVEFHVHGVWFGIGFSVPSPGCGFSAPPASAYLTTFPTIEPIVASVRPHPPATQFLGLSVLLLGPGPYDDVLQMSLGRLVRWGTGAEDPSFVRAGSICLRC